MSTKKISTTVGLAAEVFARLEREASFEQRSRSFIVEKILREYYALPWEEGKEVKVNANKT